MLIKLFWALTAGRHCWPAVSVIGVSVVGHYRSEFRGSWEKNGDEKLIPSGFGDM